MEIKELLQQTAEKYHAALTYPELHIEEYEPQKQVAEITGFPDTLEGKMAKIGFRCDVEEELDKLKVDYKTTTAFNPNKITVEWQEAK